MNKLTPKQDRFVKEFIKTGEKRNSAIKAGYSVRTAAEMAYENLNKPQIKLKIEKVMSEAADKLGITAEYILSGLKKWADADSDKLASQSVKSLELLGRHRKLFHENDLNVKLSEEEKHKETQKILDSVVGEQ